MASAGRELASGSAHRVLIVGFGNDLMGDDGVGLAVIERLRERGLPAGVRAEAAGSDALQLASLWRGEPEIWLVDALLGGHSPGIIRVIQHAELLARPQRHATAHHLSLPECLRWLALTYPGFREVRCQLFGIEPQRLQPVEGLSPAVAAALDRIVQRILAALCPAN